MSVVAFDPSRQQTLSSATIGSDWIGAAVGPRKVWVHWTPAAPVVIQDPLPVKLHLPKPECLLPTFEPPPPSNWPGWVPPPSPVPPPVLPEQEFALPSVAVVAVWNRPVPLAQRSSDGLAPSVAQVTESMVLPLLSRRKAESLSPRPMVELNVT